MRFLGALVVDSSRKHEFHSLYTIWICVCVCWVKARNENAFLLQVFANFNIVLVLYTDLFFSTGLFLFAGCCFFSRGMRKLFAKQQFIYLFSCCVSMSERTIHGVRMLGSSFFSAIILHSYFCYCCLGIHFISSSLTVSIPFSLSVSILSISFHLLRSVLAYSTDYIKINGYQKLWANEKNVIVFVLCVYVCAWAESV